MFSAERHTVDRIERIERELQSLQALVIRLREEITALQREQRLHQAGPVEKVLAQRGQTVLSHGSRAQTLLSLNHSFAQDESFYRLMRRYSFRLFLRDLIQCPQGDRIESLSRYCSVKTVRSYMTSLSELGIIELQAGGSYRLLRRNVPSFGPTLEWYVCELFQREFLAPALFNVKLRHTRYGGDYDVIALLLGYLGYIEVKSSPPRGVELPAVTAFLNRLCDLEPHLSIFLVDTELRMNDKIVPLFTEALRRLGRPEEGWPVERLADELFHVRHSIYLINSRKGIYSNLRVCIRDFLRRQKGIQLPLRGLKDEDSRGLL